MTTESATLMRFEDIETGYQAVRWHEPVIHELSRKGSTNQIVPEADGMIRSKAGDVLSRIPERMHRKSPPSLPELSEPEIMRHYLRLSQQTFGFDSGINIGLGTCTMKYSPKINDQLARLPLLSDIHPLQPEGTIQGILQLTYELRDWLCELSGMDEFCFQPRGGSHGVYTNACIIRAYHRARGDAQRDEIITCAVSHPCNAGCPSTAGFRVIQLYPDRETGDIGLDALKAALSHRTAGLMMTAPYDTGVFDSQIGEYIKLVHEAGGLVALDQANFNGVMTRMRAGDVGADLMQFNLHKTFSTPHGSCGPGTGAVGVKKELKRFLPVPIVEYDGKSYHLNYDLPNSIGKIGSFMGVVMNSVKAYAWIMSMGTEGLRAAAEWAVINNNYLVKKLLEIRGIDVAWPSRGKLQEARFTLERLKEDTGVGTSEFNNRVIDYGIQGYFESHEPVIIPEPVTPEASDTVSKEDLDRFIEIFRRVSEEAYANPEIVTTAPHRCAVHQTNPGPLVDPSKSVVTWRAHLNRNE
jgi:glycine dehydrogenase subunit 2